MEVFEKLRNMTTLLIDDDEWIRDSLCIFFNAKGCLLDAVETAEEGVRALRNRFYDILIVDYCLPGMDGLEFLIRIRDSHPDTLKLMISAYGSHDIFTQATEAGVDYIIEKPFDISKIRVSLGQMIETP
ncbi:response regulator [Desulfonema ishimotonii]|uniref:Response regulator n=1 Tax=Desulfonema ishimotonii TaxID=45657 RepID=A0A401FUU1_9BACT|nr:response regulator [Desulfonema ishimotonii]GBC60742.1 response regulator [Desulfonema ishimotonii]